MIIKRLLHIVAYTIAIFALVKWGHQGYERLMLYLNPPIVTSAAMTTPKAFRSTLAIPDAFLSYSFAHMLEIIDAAQKAKYLEYQAYLAGTTSAVPTNTLVALAQDLYHEKTAFKQFVRSMRDGSTPLSSKRTRSLNYYLRVLDLHLQDVDNMIAKRYQGKKSS